MEISQIIDDEQRFFATQKTKDPAYRKASLIRLREAVKANEAGILQALHEDLNKSESEAYMTEVGMVYDELNYLIRHLESWAKPKRVPTPLAQFYSTSRIIYEPFGAVLIMAPWNYPFQLSVEPLASALAAGNTAVLKPSAYSPATSHIIAKIIADAFPPEYVAVVEGGRAENAALLDQAFDYIFFTGSVAVGKLAMAKAAEHLTPVTLELGGKSPVIVDHTADLKTAAARIVFGKYLNAGQTCVAPDYLLIEKSVKDRFLDLAVAEIRKFWGPEPLNNPDYVKIINQKHYDRLCGLIAGQQVIYGGKGNGTKIEPTIVDEVSPADPIMQEEIFGPILPVLAMDNVSSMIELISSRPKPLALYLFTNDRSAEREVLKRCSFGGGCVNDTIVHLSTHYLGFGGVGSSGMGRYHGRFGFDTFSNHKAVLKKANWPDLDLRYPPYTAKKYAALRHFLK